MEEFLQFLDQYNYFGNSGREYFYALIAFVATIVILKLFQLIILVKVRKWAESTKTKFDDVLLDVISSVKTYFYFISALYLSFLFLVVPVWLNRAVAILFLISATLEVVRAIDGVIDHLLERYQKQLEESGGKRATSKPIINATRVALKIIVWFLAVTIILSNLGVNVTSLIASLGVGGIAIALALKNILSDIFSSFTIYIDKPFEVGDTIVVGTDKGKVEKIGLKSTRLRTPLGEQLIISNQELTTTRVQNFEQMKERRVLLQLQVEYGTPHTKLKKIPGMLKNLVKEEGLVRFDRCSFADFMDSGLMFELSYYVQTTDYKKYMSVRQKINIAIYRAFEREEIVFAFPTQTVFVRKD